MPFLTAEYTITLVTLFLYTPHVSFVLLYIKLDSYIRNANSIPRDVVPNKRSNDKISCLDCQLKHGYKI